MTAPRAVPSPGESRRECHWCGGHRASIRARLTYRLERALRRSAGRVRDWHDCCTFCHGSGKGRR